MTMNCPLDLARFTPPSMRKLVAEGEPPLYRLHKPDYDRLPLNTFIVGTQIGTTGRLPVHLIRVVKPRDANKYPPIKRTPDNRLLYVCWRNGMAVKSIEDAAMGSYRHIVVPGADGYDLLEAFMTACDIRRGFVGRPMRMKPDLLLRALDIDKAVYVDLRNLMMRGSRTDPTL